LPSVKVRIAVAVNSRGGWHAYGEDGQTDSERAAEALAWLTDGSDPCRVSFVEAEIPLPTHATIQGTVK
jgi:hypothetical protein